ncbi:MAG TPA: EamA family transporter [Candidatus Paceibacterota bacterium]|jgi:drug/metabolite transporter (DMT)-like permease|nr:EamA family transporter [Candidatus Paceibacterota bacterium]
MWFFLATVASMCWGVSYILAEHIFKRISVYTTLVIECFLMGFVILIVAIKAGDFKKDLVTLTSSSKLMLTFVLFTTASIIAELAINFSISEKDATLAGFVEISYPFFIALFAYLLFGQEELHPGTAFGGVVVFVGACIIFYFSR